MVDVGNTVVHAVQAVICAFTITAAVNVLEAVCAPQNVASIIVVDIAALRATIGLVTVDETYLRLLACALVDALSFNLICV